MRELLIVLALGVVPVAAGESEPGHAHALGDAAELGQVSFPVSCSAAARGQFERAVAMLHSFWYEASEEAFLQVAKTDPSCAMAYWGLAMSLWHPLWPPAPGPDAMRRGREAVDRALAIGGTSARERAFIEAIGAYYNGAEDRAPAERALAYESAMAGVQARFQDSEARAFYALALLATAPATDKGYANQRKAAAILEPIFRAQPRHPGAAHYIIHALDVPALAPQALEAARSYAKIAPGVPHALHMPSHIFTRLGLWHESIASNVASAAAARRFAEESHMVGAWDEELHALDYLEYAYLQCAQDEKARQVLESLRGMAGLGQGSAKASYAFAAIPARYALERGQWAEAAGLPDAPQGLPHTRALTEFARGYGRARLGDSEAAQAQTLVLAELRDQLLGKRDRYWADQVEIERLAVGAWALHASGRDADAILAMRAAVDLEEATEKLPVTPGPLVPASELLGELLIEAGRGEEAFASFQDALKDSPDRLRSLSGASRAATLAGEQDAAKRYAGRLLEITAAGEVERAAILQARALVARP